MATLPLEKDGDACIEASRRAARKDEHAAAANASLGQSRFTEHVPQTAVND